MTELEFELNYDYDSITPEELFEIKRKDINLVNNPVLFKKYETLFNYDYDEIEQELLIILWKACIGWYKNKVYKKRYKQKNGLVTCVFFRIHFIEYVRGYMGNKSKSMKNPKNNFIKYVDEYNEEFYNCDYYRIIELESYIIED